MLLVISLLVISLAFVFALEYSSYYTQTQLDILGAFQNEQAKLHDSVVDFRFGFDSHSRRMRTERRGGYCAGRQAHSKRRDRCKAEVRARAQFEDCLGGDPVNFVLAEDLTVGNVVVAKAGAKAVGTVTNAKKAGMMGKGGELNVRLEHVKVGDTKIRLRGTKGKEGDSKTGTAVALTVLFGPIGLIKHGKEIVVKEGTPLGAYVDDDIALAPAP